MASASSLLSEEMFLCSICLDVFTEPVSTPCGHNFCKDCITKYWDTNDKCYCPMCQKCFVTRPDLLVNTLISEMSVHLRKRAEFKPDSSTNTDRPDQEAAKPMEVPCDVCPGVKLKALKSCLVCLASYCESHLEPHQRVAALQRHKLINPVVNLEDRMCKRHDKMLELFCRTDQLCVCVMCTDHKTHDTVPLEEEYEKRAAQLGKTNSEVKQTIQERLQKVQEINHSVVLNKKDTEKEIADTVEAFTALVASIQRRQAELIDVIEEKQREAEKQAEGLITELEQEITELQKKSIELEKLSHTEDYLHVLHSVLSFSPPATKDWSEISVSSQLCGGTVRRALAQLEETLSKEMETLLKCMEKMIDLPEDIKLKRIQQQYAVDVTLDPDTAHPRLILSENRKQVRCGNQVQFLFYNPNRFDERFAVLGNKGFSSGKFYYEVQVKGKTKWDLGVVKKSVSRKGKIATSPLNGCWIIRLKNSNDFTALADPRIPLPLIENPEKIGVFVDYEEGLISFYDVEAKALIYSFTGCTFTEKLHPYFRPWFNDKGANSAPMIITPVKHEE